MNWIKDIGSFPGFTVKCLRLLLLTSELFLLDRKQENKTC